MPPPASRWKRSCPVSTTLSPPSEITSGRVNTSRKVKSAGGSRDCTAIHVLVACAAAELLGLNATAVGWPPSMESVPPDAQLLDESSLGGNSWFIAQNVTWPFPFTPSAESGDVPPA